MAVEGARFLENGEIEASASKPTNAHTYIYSLQRLRLD